MQTSPTPSRRAVLGRAAAVGATAAAASIVLPGVARAATSYVPAHYKGARLLSATGRHLVGRLSYGVTPALAAEVIAAGGGSKWFEKQLDANAISDPATDALVDWYPSLSRDPQDLWQRQIEEIEGGWEVMADYARWVMLRRLHAKRQVLETMTEFWENHFNVPVWGDATFTWRSAYGATIRGNALGRFDDLLLATITHPAMLIYLDGAVSTATHPNENLGRELLELHSVGRGNYTEDDVKNSARILTGWSVDLWETWAADYKTEDHWRGPVTVMGFSNANAAADGRGVTRRYLTYLAHHPATAHRIARKLAVKFVGDDPPAALVEKLAQVYLDNGTAIKPVLRALVASSAFASSSGSKVRDPGEDVVATYRVLGVDVAQPPEGEAGDDYAATAMLWQVASLGTSPFAWPRPDGQPIDNDSWSSPSRLIASMEVHWAMSGGWWPSVGLTYREPMDWLPKASIRFDKLVDHLSQQLLHRRSTARLLQACCEACDVEPTEKITADHGLVRWNFYRLLTTFLDSPAHLTR